MKTPMCKGKLVLDTELVQVYFTGAEHRMFIKMKEGGTVEHEPFPGNLTGLVASLQVATEICAGKFFLKRMVEATGDAPMVDTMELNATPIKSIGSRS